MASGFFFGDTTTLSGSRPAAWKEIAKDKSVKKQNLHHSALEPMAFLGRKTLFPIHAFSSTQCSPVQMVYVEEKQKMRDGNVIPDTPPSTPLVPSGLLLSGISKKLTKSLRGVSKSFGHTTVHTSQLVCKQFV